jgi:hypothetical protein
MRRTNLNFLVDLLLLLACSGLLLTGLLMRCILPPGTGMRHAAEHGGGGGLSLYGLGRHDYGDVHFWLAVVAVGLFILHVALHWNWVCTVIKGWFVSKESAAQSMNHGLRNTIGVVFLIILIGGFVAFFLYSRSAVQQAVATEDLQENQNTQPRLQKSKVEEKRHPEEQFRRAGQAGIRGNMTLAEIEELTGVPVNRILRELELPLSIPRDSRLGRLRRKYDFEMQDVRAAVRRNVVKPHKK